jgi:hypothetical protein
VYIADNFEMSAQDCRSRSGTVHGMKVPGDGGGGIVRVSMNDEGFESTGRIGGWTNRIGEANARADQE